jgi:hypothetical protein
MMPPVGFPEEAAERDRLRREAPECWAAVHAAVAGEDPEGLLALGTPADEYDPEIADLVGLVLNESVTEGRVLEIWEGWFGPGSGLADHPEVLRRLTAALTGLQPDRPTSTA